MKRVLTVFLFIAIFYSLPANSYTGSSDADSMIVRIPVWVFLETVPGSNGQDARDSLPPRKALTKLSAFLLSGMTFGWKFSYTPYDKIRSVEEFFELTPVYEISTEDAALKITELRPAYPYLYCWAEYSVAPNTAKRREFWKSISYKTSKGRGEGKRDQEINGVYNAYINAAKQSVRNYARTLTKNKPREIIGEMIIKDNPRLYMKSGTFYAELEVYIQIKEIVPYKVF
ncbi:MAG: hypothetical protein CR988_05385 [Treponema sp.]|nr:MAG: hypothetical protein CR988_05385 [Treponema sp.]